MSPTKAKTSICLLTMCCPDGAAQVWMCQSSKLWANMSPFLVTPSFRYLLCQHNLVGDNMPTDVLPSPQATLGLLHHLKQQVLWLKKRKLCLWAVNPYSGLNGVPALSGTSECDPIWKQGLCMYGEWRWGWTGLTEALNLVCSDQRGTVTWRRRPCEVSDRSWSDAAASQAMPRISWRHRNGEDTGKSLPRSGFT